MTEKDINKEFTRVKKFVLESQYPDLTPDRDSDWHNSDHCEMTDCTVTAWTTFTRRHHCRMCARSVCGNHSRQKKDIRAWDLKHVRVCDPCAEGLNRGGVLYHELELDPGTEAFKKLFTSRSIEEWKDLIEYLGLEWERKVMGAHCSHQTLAFLQMLVPPTALHGNMVLSLQEEHLLRIALGLEYDPLPSSGASAAHHVLLMPIPSSILVRWSWTSLPSGPSTPR